MDNTFPEQVSKVLTQTASDYKHANEDRISLVKEIMEYEIRGARGKMVKHLLGFALDANWWSVYAQQYNKNKLPFIIQEKPLRKLVFTYKRILELEEDGTDADTIDAYIRGFEYSLVRDVGTYTAFNSGSFDFTTRWKSQSMSFKQLSAKPLKYHKVWKYFFTDRENKSIPKLILDIEKMIDFHVRSRILYSQDYCNSENMKNIINGLGSPSDIKVQSVNVDDFKTTLTAKAMEDDIVRALYDEEASEASDSESEDENESDNEQEVIGQKRKAIIADPAPITNMMETLVDSVKRQRTDDERTNVPVINHVASIESKS